MAETSPETVLVVAALAACLCFWVGASLARRRSRSEDTDLRDTLSRQAARLDELSREVLSLRVLQTQQRSTDVAGGVKPQDSSLTIELPLPARANGAEGQIELDDQSVSAEETEEDSLEDGAPKYSSGGRIKHLVVTRRGDRWVSDRLPKDDYNFSDEAPPSVDSLISKPIGYRLVAGHNLLHTDDSE